MNQREEWLPLQDSTSHLQGQCNLEVIQCQLIPYRLSMLAQWILEWAESLKKTAEVSMSYQYRMSLSTMNKKSSCSLNSCKLSSSHWIFHYYNSNQQFRSLSPPSILSSLIAPPHPFYLYSWCLNFMENIAIIIHLFA